MINRSDAGPETTLPSTCTTRGEHTSEDSAQDEAALSASCESADLGTEGIIARVYDELKVIARRHMKRERPGHTLQTTILVHEAFLRLRNDRQHWLNEEQFKATCALAIRRLLADHARRSLTSKRSKHRSHVELDQSAELATLDAQNMIEIDLALDELRDLDERQARVVELRFFGGLTIEEAAKALGCSPRTIDTDWRLARAWLRRRLDEGDP